jgi:hypothetical protein
MESPGKGEHDANRFRGATIAGAVATFRNLKTLRFLALAL